MMWECIPGSAPEKMVNPATTTITPVLTTSTFYNQSVSQTQINQAAKIIYHSTR